MMGSRDTSLSGVPDTADSSDPTVPIAAGPAAADGAHIDGLERENASLERAGRHGYGQWLIVALSVLVTVIAWYGAESSLLAKTEQRFDREAERLVELFTDQMQRYEDLMRASVAAIASNSGDISRENWERFAGNLNLADQFPAVSAVAVMPYVSPESLEAFLVSQRRYRVDYALRPEHDQPYHLPVMFVTPAEIEDQAAGLDLAFNANRRQAIMRSVYLNRPQLSAPITLAITQQLGITMYAPFYRGGANPSWQDRKQEFAGVVGGTVVISKLAEELLGTARRQVTLRVSDDGDVLYDDASNPGFRVDPSPLYSRSKSLDVYGRQWQFDISTTLAFREEASGHLPLYILFGGLVVDGLLLALILMLRRTSQRAVALTHTTTRELREKAARLERSNQDLESFAYVVTHDLKAPLRGIQDLTGYIEEDLQPYLEQPDAVPDVSMNFNRIHQQVGRANALIEGVLNYSGIGTQHEQSAEVDTRELVNDIGQSLDVSMGSLVLTGDFPVFNTYETRLTQVLSNLIGNAFKYHHDVDKAVVEVSVEDTGGWYRFSVSDNGPGIDHKFHDQIFDAFKTLQSRDDIESTGVGLSIVKKSVELLGGGIRVRSEPGNGTTFVFTWPKTVSACSLPSGQDASKAA